MSKKKTEKQIFYKWVLMIVIAVFLGGVAGVFSVPLAEKIHSFFAEFTLDRTVAAIATLGCFILVNVLVYIYSFYQYRTSKKMIKNWDKEDEELISHAEKRLDYAMFPMNLITSYDYFFVALLFYFCDIMADDMELHLCVIALIGAGVFFISMMIQVFYQKKILDVIKYLNPEKKGNIFDKKFAKDWENSCDEAQQLIIYKSAYSGYKATSVTCQILWALSFMSMIVFDTGLLPVFCVTVVFTVIVVAYYRTSIKLEYRN